MEKQISFSEVEYGQRQRKTKREQFLKKMDEMIPWDECVAMIAPYYPKGKRGRPPREIEQMLRMLLLQTWFNLSDEGVEDAIYDSYAMKTFMGVDFASDKQVPDATTLCKFRKMMTTHHLQKGFFDIIQNLLKHANLEVVGGVIVDATIISAPNSTKNAEKKRDPEMHSVKKGNNYYFGMRTHIGVDPYYGFVRSVISTPANESEVTVAPELIQPTDTVIYGDAGYCKLESYVNDEAQHIYQINRQRGPFKRHYGDDLGWKYEKHLERQKSRVRCKVEYMFHIVKDIFHWRKLRYKGIAKNNAFAHLAFATANLFLWTTMG